MELFRAIVAYYKSNARFGKIALGLIFPTIGLLSACVGIFASVAQNATMMTTATAVTVLVISFQCVMMCNISLIWINDYYISSQDKDRAKVETTGNPLEAAKLKSQILSSIGSLPPNYEVYASSHNNFFVNPEGRDENECMAVRAANEEVFTELAKLILRGRIAVYASSCSMRMR